MPEVARRAVILWVPIVSQLQHRSFISECAALVFGCGEKDQCKAAFFIFDPADDFQPELVSVEIQALIDVADANHGVEVTHDWVIPFAFGA